VASIRSFFAKVLFLVLCAGFPAGSEVPTRPTALAQPSTHGQVMTRIKDISRVVGLRDNQLVGYGLVVGLDNTGDDQEFTNQSLQNLLERFNITVNLDDIDADNAAAVMVTVDLPPFTAEGTRLDVLVSSIGDAETLQGGTLLLTELRGPDGQVYALAQGPVSLGGFIVRAGGGGGQRVQKNHATVGRIPGGAIVEYPVESQFVQDGIITLALDVPDFSTASNIQSSIDRYFNIHGLAQASDPGTVKVNLVGLKHLYRNPVEMIAELEKIPVHSDVSARVIINERTGTIVSGHNVRISTVAISHGALTIEVRSRTEVSQPPPFSPGVTVPTEQTELQAYEETTTGPAGQPFGILREGATVEELVAAFQAIDGGLTPRDLIAIFQALKEAGALKAELIIM